MGPSQKSGKKVKTEEPRGDPERGYEGETTWDFGCSIPASTRWEAVLIACVLQGLYIEAVHPVVDSGLWLLLHHETRLQ